jgi:adenylosuccinate synthase
LPDQAREYLEFIEQRAGVPIALVGIGQRRDQTITRREVLAAA